MGGNLKSENVLVEKSFAFAVRVVKACQYLVKKKSEHVLSKQLLRCGNSIGANVEEAMGGQSRADFAAKLGIAYKEAREAQYWIRLLRETAYFSESEADSLLHDVVELQKIIGSIRVTLKTTSTTIRNS
jgi:four helix bundle protein